MFLETYSSGTTLRQGFDELSPTPQGNAYQFTSQRNETALGLYFYNARWYDPYLNRFTQPDSIVPTQTQGTQA